MKIRSTLLARALTLTLVMLSVTLGMAQNKTVTGTVQDQAGNGLPGVSYLVKGTNNGGATDARGKFRVNIASDSPTIVFSSIGFLSKEVPVGNASILTVTLDEDTKLLNEVVVTGFGMTTETRKLSYAATTVNGTEITRANNANIVNALQGKVAGVMINQGTGGPMSSSRIRIRGNASLGGNTQPLFVIDGVLIRPGTTGADSWGAGQDFGNIMKNINPDNIESMTVLKGSAASALYGSEALNGVVVVQTKKGRNTKGLGVNYNVTTSFENAFQFLDLQNQYGAGLNAFPVGADGMREVERANNNWVFNYGPKFDGQPVRDLDGRMIPWQANDPLNFFQTGKFINHNVAIEGGNDRGSFRAAYSGLTNTTIMPAGTEMKRNNFNIRGTQKIGKIFNLDVSADYTDNDMVNPIRQGGNFNPVFRFVFVRPRSLDIDYWSRNYADPIAGGRRQGVNDPYNISSFMWDTFEDRQVRNEKVFRTNVDLNGKLTPWLSFLLRGNIQTQLNTGSGRQPGPDPGFSGGYYSEFTDNENQSRIQGILMANHSFGDNFDVTFNVGGESNRINGGRNFSARTNGGLRVPRVYSLANSQNTLNFGNGLASSRRIDALYAYGDVTYKDALTFNFSVRNDWSSTLTYADGSGNHSYSYPAVGLAWIFTESLSNVPTWLSFGKLRASYGFTGGDTDAYSTNRTGNYRPNGVYTLPDGSQINISDFSDNTLPNYNLKNRLAREWELGADIRFFSGRLGLDVTVYNKLTRNEILRLPIASESGLNSQLVNAGEIQNKGIELLINATPIKKGKFEWNTNVNFTRNRNMILDLVAGTDRVQLASGFGNDIQSIAKVGEQYGMLVTPLAFATYKSTDPNHPSNGQRVIGAASGTTGGFPSFLRTGAYGQGAKELGTMMESFLLSSMNNIRYGNFTATVQLDGKFGGLMGSATHQYGSANGSFANSLFGRDAETGGVRFTDARGVVRNDGIIPEGVLADGYKVKVGETQIDLGGMPYAEAVEKGYLTPIPAFAYYDNLSKWGSGIREYSVFENSWVSLREVSVGYNVPAAVLEKFKVQSLSVNLVGRNLMYLYRTAKDGINPEGLYSNRPGEFMEYGGLPFSRNLGVSVNIGL